MPLTQDHRTGRKKWRRHSDPTHSHEGDSLDSHPTGQPRPFDTAIARAAKRGIDVSLAATTGLLCLPLLIVIAAVIKCTSRGPVLYGQVRLGQHGKPFRMLKFRTMVEDAEQRLDEYLGNNPDHQQEWSTSFKVRNDPRVVPWIGPFLRNTSLDELPQLWNVLAGQMSMVGPRPLPHYHRRQLSEEAQQVRELMLPGITGQWQVRDRRDGHADTIQKWDTDYVENWSLLLDLKILARTPLSLLAGALGNLPEISKASLIGNRDRDPHA